MFTQIIKVTPKIELLTSKHLVDYKTALTVMDEYVTQMLAIQKPGALWLLEHPAIYTKGTSSNNNDLLKPDLLPVYETGRGGQFTYHGPGQRIAYIMLDIKKIHNNRPDLRLFVQQIERWIIASLADMGIEAFIRHNRVGVWVFDNDGKEVKIAAIGIRVKKWISFHGIALNISPNMDHFAGIVPCGIKDFGVTSLNLLGKHLGIESIDKILQKNFCTIFNLELDDAIEI